MWNTEQALNSCSFALELAIDKSEGPGQNARASRTCHCPSYARTRYYHMVTEARVCIQLAFMKCNRRSSKTLEILDAIDITLKVLTPSQYKSRHTILVKQLPR